jgi:hypothetical protein
MKNLGIISVGALFALYLPISQAAIDQVTVINKSEKSVYIHKGGYAPSFKLTPGESRSFDYPFSVVPPGKDKTESTSLLVGSSGGRWMTSPNGTTFLEKPSMLICLDYASKEYQDKTGDRVWTIQKAEGFDAGCEVKSYNQPWYIPK